MLTLFTTPKPFRGDIGRIQRNAIRSWLALSPSPQVLVIGEGEGVAENCNELGVVHIPEVATAASGVPLLTGLFERARAESRNEILGYVNADIILTSDLPKAIDEVRAVFSQAVLICAPVNVPFKGDLDTKENNWEGAIRSLVAEVGAPPTRKGADLFVYPKDFYDRVPRLAIGRGGFDNWLIWRAILSGLPAVEITHRVLAIHQDHSASMHAGNPVVGDDASRNLELVGWRAVSWPTDLPYSLATRDSVTRRYRFPRLRLRTCIVLRQMDAQKIRLLSKTYRLRRRLGLYRWWNVSARGLPWH